MVSTKDEQYTARLLSQRAWWKRVLDVQRPYRMHLRHMDLGVVLDIGCGVGRNLINLGKGSGNVGVDHNPHSVAVARSYGLNAFTPRDFARSRHARPNAFDALLLAHVVEHMPYEDVMVLVNDYIGYLRPGGRLVMITPQEVGYRSDPTHVQFVDFELSRRMISDLGLKILKQYSFPFPRVMGKLFIYNEFVTISARPDPSEAE